MIKIYKVVSYSEGKPHTIRSVFSDKKEAIKFLEHNKKDISSRCSIEKSTEDEFRFMSPVGWTETLVTWRITTIEVFETCEEALQ